MATQEEATVSHAALFPQPPPFYKHFTTDNLARLREAQEAAGIKPPGPSNDRQETTQATRELDLPPELRYLVPPAPPASGKFRSFGVELDINEPTFAINEPTFERQYPNPAAHDAAGDETDPQWTFDRATYLRKSVRAALLNFLELTRIMVRDPKVYGNKIHHINLNLMNAHQLINEYRPHQARETLILMMEQQLEKKKAEVEGIKKMKEKIEGLLKSVGKEGLETVTTADTELALPLSPAEKRREEQRGMWTVLGEEMGT